MTQKQSKTFKLYDNQTIWILAIALLVITYKTATKNYRYSELQITAFLNIALLWILALFKIWKIEVLDNKTIVFRGILRKIIVSPEEIISFQDWMRGIRIVLKDKSIILWPYIDKQDQFKSLLSNLNSNIKFIDEAHEATKSGKRVFLLTFGVFLYLAGLAAWLFYVFTHHGVK
jgi:hypothetical protein